MTKAKRSGHKKSTAGCANCKRRHLKCDETRPSCIHCLTQGRHCPYLNESLPEAPTSAPTPTTSSVDESLAGHSSLVNETDDVQTPSSGVHLTLPEPSFKLVYVELLQQWLAETHRTYAHNEEHSRIYESMTLDQALAFPFLMHAILANAALHLSVKIPEKSIYYRAIVAELSSQALAEFNANLSELNEKSIVAAFLFSSITSTHQLCECFISSMQDFDTFIRRFTDCLKISRGVNVVIRGWWPFLQKTELRPILTTLERLQTDHDIDRGTPEFDDVRQLVQSMDGVNSTKTTAAYIHSIRSLQRSLNIQHALGSPEFDKSLSWLFSWPVNADELIPLLELKRPEAVVILAYYAPLVHYRYSSWAIGSAGATMFRFIESALGPTWEKWLQWPKEAISITCIE